MKIVNVQQMQALEAASAQAGVSTDTLMENAGLAVADLAMRQLDNPRGARVLVLVGPGNNGGDGLVAARRLHQWGARVYVYLCAHRRSPDPKLEVVLDRGMPVIHASEDSDFVALNGHLKSCSLVIDAVLGTGRARTLEGTLRDIFAEVGRFRTQRDLPLLAIDLPTGLNADSGAMDPAGVGADITAALGYPKVGHVTFPGAEAGGRLEVVDIGIPGGLDQHVPLELVTARLIRPLIPKRPINSHKGTFGRLVVVAGSRNYVGAPYLACSGAYRAGAGLVTLAAAWGAYTIASTKLAETTHIPLPETEAGAISGRALETLCEALAGPGALVIGCGLGQEGESQELVQRLLSSHALDGTPAVIDADALNALALQDAWYRQLTVDCVLTPHPGEMSRLTGETTSRVQERRLEIAQASARDWGQVVVLKGAHTIIASPDGRTRISPFANPGLASAGTGDVLAGVIGGLLAQGLSTFDAATCGVYVHGAAAEAVRQQLGDTGMTASDLLPEIPRQIKRLKEEA